MIEITSNELAAIICKISPDLKPSFMDENNIIWKWVGGEWIGKPGVKDPNYSGHRYIWEEEI